MPTKIRAAATAAVLKAAEPSSLVGLVVRFPAGASTRQSRSLFNSPFGMMPSSYDVDTYEQVVAYVAADRHGSVGKWVTTQLISPNMQQQQQHPLRGAGSHEDPMFVDLVQAAEAGALTIEAGDYINHSSACAPIGTRAWQPFHPSMISAQSALNKARIKGRMALAMDRSQNRAIDLRSARAACRPTLKLPSTMGSCL